jgi:hypothetical protein
MQPYEAATRIRSQNILPEDAKKKITIFNSVYSALSYDIISLNKLINSNIIRDEFNVRYTSYERYCNETKLLWLFSKNHLKKLDKYKDELMLTLIEHCSPDLKLNDYILLFYISLESTKMRKSLTGIPLSMLHEIYDPVADSRIEAWRNKMKTPKVKG